LIEGSLVLPIGPLLVAIVRNGWVPSVRRKMPFSKSSRNSKKAMSPRSLISGLSNAPAEGLVDAR
jgi:hypothetical protein